MKARTYLYIRFWGDEERIFDDEMGLGRRERYVQKQSVYKMALPACLHAHLPDFRGIIARRVKQ
jgi:hypothetical protein